MKVGITGHRFINDKGVNTLKQVMYSVIKNKNISEITFGGAIGVDSLGLLFAAEAMVEYNRSDVLLRVIIPDTVKAQPESTWNVTRSLASEIIELKNEITSMDNYESYKTRNIEIIKNSDLILAFWNGNKRSGTYHCINNTKKMNKLIKIFDI